MMHQEYFLDPYTPMVWKDRAGEIQPINEINLVKNKISGGKGLIYSKFDTTHTIYYDVGPEEKAQIESKMWSNKAISKNNNKSLTTDDNNSDTFKEFKY